MSKTMLRIGLITAGAAIHAIRQRTGKLPHPSLEAEMLKQRIELSKMARAGNLALNFLRNKPVPELPHRPYDQGHVTSKALTRTKPDWDLVEKIVREEGSQYFSGEQEMLQRFAEFKDSAMCQVCN